MLFSLMGWCLEVSRKVVFSQRRLVEKRILEDEDGSLYSIHPSSTKMYYDLKEVFWWGGKKEDKAKFVAKCSKCQQVKAEHQKSGSLLQESHFLLGSGKTSIWIFWCFSLGHKSNLTLYGWL